MADTLLKWTVASGNSASQLVQYRVVGATNWSTYGASLAPTVSQLTVTLPVNNYEFQIVNTCTNNVQMASPKATNYMCNCPTGFTKNVLTGKCEKIGTAAPIVTNSNYCFASAQNAAYSALGTRVYNVGFSNATLAEVTASRPQDVYAQYNEAGAFTGQWVNNNTLQGPMNRVSVWSDSNCDGVPDSLAFNTKTTVAFAYNNITTARRMYVGIGGDNLFSLVVNGVEVAKTNEVLVSLSNSPQFFKFWHIIPVDVDLGWNYFNAICTGDGARTDAIGMVIYDVQTPQAFDGNHYGGVLHGFATYDVGLNVIFKSSDLIGQKIDIATCATGTLDTSGGAGHYICRISEKTDCV